MQSTTTNRKEQAMKAIVTHKLVRLAAVAAPAATLAASAGSMHWSDANLKREIQPLEGSLRRIRSL
jgi:hypothetical protein